MRLTVRMRTAAVRFVFLFGVALSVLPLGCGGSGGTVNVGTLYPVTGKVILPGGKPLSTGRVEFVPVKGGPSIFGDLESDGSFKLKTGDGQEGAPSGDYKIRLEPTSVATKKATNAKGIVYPFPSFYADEDANTGLTATVKAEPNTLAPFKLSESRPGGGGKSAADDRMRD